MYSFNIKLFVPDELRPLNSLKKLYLYLILHRKCVTQRIVIF